MHRVFTTDRGDAGERLDRVVQRHLTDLDSATRTRVQSWITQGLVVVNGRITRRVATRTMAGDEVQIDLPDVQSRSAPTAEELPLDILHEDDALLVVNKPPGIVVHPTYKHTSGTLLNALLWHGRRWPAAQRPSVVGRLDKMTSGLVLVAKTADVHAALQATLSSHASRKDYLALVWGPVEHASGVIDLRLHRDPADRRRVMASDIVGAVSCTEYTRLATASVAPVEVSLLRCRLLTGRMHQIRVHLSARGWPIVGDPKYGDARWTAIADDQARAQLSSFARQALHAWRYTFRHPVGGETLQVEAPLASDMDALASAVLPGVYPLTTNPLAAR